jgi:uncharacterized protein YqgQ
MKENWKIVYTADRLYKVELVKGLLDQDDIESVIMNKKDSEFPVGDVELFVDEKDYEKARAIVLEHHKESE